MLTRRSMLCALGLGVPAAAIAAALPAAPAADVLELSHPAIRVDGLSMIDGNMGKFVIGKGGFEPFMFIDAEGVVLFREDVLVNGSIAAPSLSVSDIANRLA